LSAADRGPSAEPSAGHPLEDIAGKWLKMKAPDDRSGVSRRGYVRNRCRRPVGVLANVSHEGGGQESHEVRAEDGRHAIT